MKINKDKTKIWCEQCHKWIDIEEDTYEIDGFDDENGRICCLNEEEIGTHILGYANDPEWRELYG